MSHQDINPNDELTLKEIIIQISIWLKYILSKWFILLSMIGIGVLAGFLFSKYSDTKYTAAANFVIEGAGGGSGGGLGAMIGISGGDGNAGLFTSIDNIIWLYSSDELLSKTFLTPISEEGENKGELLINLFTKTSKKLHEELDRLPAEYRDVYYDNADTSDMSQLKVNYLRICIGILKGVNLTVSKVDKTENIVSVKVVADNQEFAFNFNKTLVSKVNQFYINSKVKKHRENVDNLQYKVDTLKAAVDRNMYEVAQSTDLNPFPNPHLKVLTVEPQKQSIDVQVLSSLYIQASQSLEIAKNELSKETPIIQIVDEPKLPLPSSKFGKVKAMIAGGAIGFLLPFLFFVIRKIYHDAMNSKDKAVAMA